MLRSTKYASPFQFSVRQLLIATTLVCVVTALIVWQPLWGTLIALAAASLLLTIVGVKTRRKGFVFCAIALLVAGSALFAYASMFVIGWQGSVKLDVYVLVIDTDTFQPVSGAQIEVLDGPPSPLEGTMPTMAQFAPATMEPGVGQLITDVHGRCKFTHRFYASGNDGLYWHSGYIVTSKTWLRVSSEGRGSVMLPIDGQSGRSRSIDDKTPVFATIPLRRQDKK